MKMICEYAVKCAIPERDCIHKWPHEKMDLACRKLYCARARVKVRCIVSNAKRNGEAR